MQQRLTDGPTYLARAQQHAASHPADVVDVAACATQRLNIHKERHTHTYIHTYTKRDRQPDTRTYPQTWAQTHTHTHLASPS
eukprot:54779-Eustigmatos_ZCMA.PRE.1